MPRLPINYENSIMYRIVCKDPEITDCYVGSTCNFIKRRNTHKTNCNRTNSKEYNYNVYKFIRANGGWNNFDLIEIEKYEAIDKQDKLKRERYWLEFYNAKLNSNIPSRTKREYKLVNQEIIKKFNFKHNNMKMTCECGCVLLKQNIISHRNSKKHLNLIENKILLDSKDDVDFKNESNISNH